MTLLSKTLSPTVTVRREDNPSGGCGDCPRSPTKQRDLPKIDERNSRQSSQPLLISSSAPHNERERTGSLTRLLANTVFDPLSFDQHNAPRPTFPQYSPPSNHANIFALGATSSNSENKGLDPSKRLGVLKELNGIPTPSPPYAHTRNQNARGGSL